MKFRDIGYAMGCMAVVVGLMMINPSFRAQQTANVNQELLQQAEEQGLLDAKVPQGATKIVENGCEVNGGVAGEITFELNEVVWTYRCADVDTAAEALPDISAVEGNFDVLETQVQQCAAEVSVSEDGVGKIIWYDSDTGAAYSLSMEANANGDTLQSIANYMHVPLAE